jgi:hypothetical protein
MQALKLAGVLNQPFTDHAEAPGDGGGERDDHKQRGENDDRAG